MRWLVLILASLAGPLMAQDEGTRLERLLEDALSGDDRDVQIEGFQGVLSGQASLDVLTISDANGVWLRVEDAVLDWNRAALLRGRLDVTELSAATIEFPRLPLPAEGEAAPEASGTGLPELPVAIEIGRLAVERAELGAALFGVEAAMSFEGSMSLADGEGSASIAANRLDAAEGRFALDASYSNATNELSLSLELEEQAGGIAAELIGLPGRPSVALALEGGGPLDALAVDFSLATDGVERLVGQANTRTAGADAPIAFALTLGGDVAALFVPEHRDFLGDQVSLVASGERARDGALRLDELALEARSLTLAGSGAIGADGLPERFALEGGLGAPDGSPVLLPVPGAEITLGQAVIVAGFDAAVGPDWSVSVQADAVVAGETEIASVNLTGGGRILDAGDGASVTAAFDVVADGVAPASTELSEALGERITGAVRLSGRPGAAFELETFSVETAGFTAQGEAAFSIIERDLEIEATAAIEASDLRAFRAVAQRPLAGRASLSATAAGRLLGGTLAVTLQGEAGDLEVGIAQLDPLMAGATALDIDARRDEAGITLERMTLLNDQVSISALGTVASEAGAFSLDLVVDDLSPVLPGETGSGTLSIVADGAAGLWGFDASFEAAQARLDAIGVADLLADVPRVGVDIDLAAQDLSRVAPLVGRAVDGSADVTGRVTGRVDATELRLALSGTATDLALGDARIDPLLAGRTLLDVAGERAGDVITVERFSIDNPQVRAEGSGGLDGDSGVILAEVSLTEIGSLVPGLSGPVDASLEADGEGGDWDFEAALAVAGARLSANGQARPFDEAPTGDMTFAFAAPDLSRFAGLAKRDLSGSVDLEGSLGGTLNTEDPFESEGRFAVVGEVVELGLGIERADPLLAGATRLAVEAARTDGLITVETLRVQNDQLQVIGWGVGDTQDGEVMLDLRLADLSLVAPELSGPGAAIVEAIGAAGRWEFSLAADGAEAEVEADGSVNFTQPVPSGIVALALRAADLSRFATLAGRPIAGSIDVEGTVAGTADLETLEADLTLAGESLRVGQRDVDTLLRGRVTGDVSGSKVGNAYRIAALSLQSAMLSLEGSGALGGPGETLDVVIGLSDIGPFTAGISGAARATGQIGPLEGSMLGVDLDATGPSGLTASVDGTADIEASDLDLSFTGGFPAALANRFIAPRTAAGAISVRGAVNGPPALESVTARVEAPSLAVIVPNFGLAFDPVAASVDVSGGSLQIGVNAAARGGGRVSVQGPLQLTPAPTASLTITLDGLRLSDPKLYETNVDGQISVSGPLAGGASIEGTVSLGTTELRIPSTGFGGGLLDGLEHRNETFAIRQTRERAGLIEAARIGPVASYPLDVTVLAPNRIFLRGRGLDAELGGSLRALGTTTAPAATGGFELIRGRLDILGQRLTLTEGRVSLEGALDPALRLVAATRSGEVEVRIIIEGRASSPEIRFESSPALPEDEVLAQLLFGRGVDTLSPLQAAQLASAVATLAGRGGEGIVGRLRTTLGFDDLDVTTSETGATDVRIGRYLGENLYTDVTIGLDGRSEVSLNLDLSRFVTAQGSVANDGETSVGIFYMRDY